MSEPPGDSASLELLEAARRAEKAQAITYRALAATAEAESNPALAQRFHDLHADEQHHYSRLTARLLELRIRPPDVPGTGHDPIVLAGWEARVAAMESAEIERYHELLEHDLDPPTRALLEEILAVEERHRSELGGKWTAA
jgi:rubrerythrin